MTFESRNDEAPPRTPYKVDTGPIPLDTLAVSPDGKGECWYRIPSWRVHFECEALKGVDLRMHRAIGSHGVWTLTEASTGMKLFAGLPHEFYIGDEGAMLAEFAAGRMLQITPEKLAEALAKGREKLRQHTPNPFAVSEKPRAEGDCQNGFGDVCKASKADGVVCPDDSCDIDDGIRQTTASPTRN